MPYKASAMVSLNPVEVDSSRRLLWRLLSLLSCASIVYSRALIFSVHGVIEQEEHSYSSAGLCIVHLSGWTFRSLSELSWSLWLAPILYSCAELSHPLVRVFPVHSFTG